MFTPLLRKTDTQFLEQVLLLFQVYPSLQVQTFELTGVLLVGTVYGIALQFWTLKKPTWDSRAELTKLQVFVNDDQE